MRHLPSVPVHWHDYYEFSYVLDGTAEHIVNGVSKPIERGSAFLLSPTDFHEILVSRGRLTCVNVVVDPLVIEDLLRVLLPEGDQLPWTMNDFSDLENDVQRLCHASAEHTVASAMALKARLCCIVAEFARLRQRDEEPTMPALSKTSAEIRHAIRYIDRHFRSPLTLADAAAIAHLSPNYFSERFSETTGTSFQAYLKNRRLQFARSLLGSTSLSVTEVSHAAGFNSVSYFGRVYRERFREAPSERRRAAPLPQRSSRRRDRARHS